MGICESKNETKQSTNVKEETNITHNKPVPFSLSDEIRKSICKIIIIKEKEKQETGTGFFMEINSSKYLITCYHVLKNVSSNIIQIEIWDKKIYNINFNNNSSRIDKDLDVVLIDIKESNLKNISFLNYDTNIIYGYSQ